MTKYLKLILFTFVISGVLGSFWLNFSHKSVKAVALSNSVYIWQREWTPPINDSIVKISPRITDFNILAASLSYNQNQFSIAPVNIDWSSFSSPNFNVSLVFRLNTAFKHLFQAKNFNKVIDAIDKIIDTNKSKYMISGIQIDYDCPTSKLGDYTNFINTLKSAFPEYKISITALPTWLKNAYFKKLVRATDHFALQLYSFETPKTINDPRGIFLSEKALSYIDRANALGRPFSIALPTYSYEVAFDQDNKFIGLRAESSPIVWGANAKIEREVTNPKEILAFLQTLGTRGAKNLQAVSWFRLPVKGDEFNWDINTLIAVINDRQPAQSIESKVVKKDSSLYEIYLVNNGEMNLNHDLEIDVDWSGDSDYFYDFVSGYTGEFKNNAHTLHLKGPAPKVGQKVLAVWLRKIQPKAQQDDFKLSEVIGHE